MWQPCSDTHEKAVCSDVLEQIMNCTFCLESLTSTPNALYFCLTLNIIISYLDYVPLSLFLNPYHERLPPVRTWGHSSIQHWLLSISPTSPLSCVLWEQWALSFHSVFPPRPIFQNTILTEQDKNSARPSTIRPGPCYVSHPWVPLLVPAYEDWEILSEWLLST